MRPYYGIAEDSVYEYTIERSRFIALAGEVHGQEEAMLYVERARKIYPAATHYCYAYVADEAGICVKMSDDGEPQGTAGIPMLDTIRKRDVRCVCVVIVRYFGGIKLGAAGLVGAYVKGTAGVLDAAGRVLVLPSVDISCVVDYAYLTTVERYASMRSLTVAGREYAERVVVRLTVTSERVKSVCEDLRELSQGTCVLSTGEEYYVKSGIKA